MNSTSRIPFFFVWFDDEIWSSWGGDAKCHDVEEAETDLTNPLKSINVKHHMLFANFSYN